MPRHGHSLFQLIATHAPIGIFMNDAAGDCVYVNERCCDKLGRPASELMGTGWARALHPEDRDAVLAAWRARESTGTFESEYRFCRPDGSTIWVSGKAAAIRDGSGAVSGYIGTISDITARKAAELALDELVGRLRALVEERERLAQDLHDSCIQSIFAVGLSLESCRSLVEREPAKVATAIGEAAANLNLVIQDLRSFISGRREQMRDFRGEIERAIQAAGRRAPRFTVEIDAAALDSLLPEQALQLLHIAREGISNIVRHARADSAQLTLRAGPRCVRLELRDDGVGFDQVSGTRRGLGLHHIGARVRKLRGDWRLSSVPGGGTRILVELPRAS